MLVLILFLNFFVRRLGESDASTVDSESSFSSSDFLTPAVPYLVTKLSELSDLDIVFWLPQKNVEQVRFLTTNTLLHLRSFVSFGVYFDSLSAGADNIVVHIIHAEDEENNTNTTSEKILTSLFQTTYTSQIWKPIVFLIFNNSDTAEQVTKTSIFRNLRIDSNVILMFTQYDQQYDYENGDNMTTAVRNSNQTISEEPQFIFMDKYTITTSNSTKPVTIFTPSNSTNVSDLIMKSVWCRRSNLQNVLFRAAATDEPDYKFESTFQDFKLVNGSAVSILNDMEYTLNFHSEGVPHYFLWEQNGTVANGKYLQNNVVDIMISQNVFQPYLLTSLRVLQPTFLFSVIAFYKAPPSHMYQLYLLPFSSAVWYVLIATMCILTVGLYIIFIVHRILESAVENENGRGEKCSPVLNTRESPSFFQFEEFSTAFLIISAAWYQQGWYGSFKYASSKILFFTSMCAGFVCFSAFSGRITQTLSFNYDPVRSFSDLKDLGYTFFYSNFSSSLPTYAKIVQKSFDFTEDFTASRTVNAMQILSETKAAAFLDYWESSELLIHGCCRDMGSKSEEAHLKGLEYDRFCRDVRTVNVDRTYIRSGMILSKHSPFTEILNMKIIQIKERGLNHKYMKNYEKNTRPFCPELANLKHETLDNSAIAISIYLLVGGYFISLCLLASEILSNYLQISNVPTIAM